MSLKESEQQLQKNNLLLLAEQFNITAAQAAVIQAKIWEQPYVMVDINAINPQQNRYFDIGTRGQKGISIQQLIYLGGKKKNEVEFAKSTVGIAELQFAQLLRNLKYELAKTFYDLYFDKQILGTIESQIEILDTLLVNYNVQSSKGNIALKEVVRLQSLSLNLKNDRNNLLKRIYNTQETFSLLTGFMEPVQPIVEESLLINSFLNKKILKDSILVLTLENNLDYLTAIKISESQELYVKWQKSLQVPDITTGANYDQRGGAFVNQVNLTLGVPLPLWNKNKGNIKIAEAQFQQTKLSKEFKKLELEAQVENYWSTWVQQQSQLKSIHKSTTDNITEVYTGMVNNFQKRNITMLEFTDFMESYNLTTIQINEIKKAWILASMGLNYITGKEIF